MKKAKKTDVLLLITICGLLMLGGSSLLLFPAPRFSESENRLLAEKPAFTWQSLRDGSYTAGFDTYTRERMPGRRLMRGVYAAAELALGKCETGNVLLCRDGSLTKRVGVSERIYEKNLKALAKLTAKADNAGCALTVAVVPCRIDARTDVLPRLYQSNTREALYDTLKEALPDAISFPHITNADEWFYTDHHWTPEGAFAAYEALGTHLGYTPFGKADFSKEVVSEHFFGTTDAAAGILGVLPDKIELWRYTGDTEFRLVKDGMPAEFAGLYDLAKLETRDGYAVFLGGNDGVLTVDLGENDTRPTLVVIKDSFANALLPFLARHYRIVAIDPRYTSKAAEHLLAGADRALFLCGMQTLTETAFLQALVK